MLTNCSEYFNSKYHSFHFVLRLFLLQLDLVIMLDHIEDVQLKKELSYWAQIVPLYVKFNQLNQLLLPALVAIIFISYRVFAS